jgi:uncharacterized repeat protein (TIGR01451 family)
MLKLLRIALPAVLLCGIGAPAFAQTVPLSGGTYNQDFDTLSNVANSTTNTALPTGWLLTETGGGARDNEQYAVDTGASNSGDTFSYGSAGSTDRAFGGLQSGTLIPVVGACFTNNTGGVLSSLDIAYTGEQWRIGNTTAARDDRMDFQINTNPGSISLTATGTWADVNTLDFTNPVKTNASAVALDGNSAANRAAVSATVNGLSIANGGNFCIRWNDLNASGSDDGLAIDNFSISVGAPAGAQLSITDVTAQEGNSGTTNFIFTFNLTQPAGPGGVTIAYSTANGTATSGSDYVGDSGSVTIPQGSNSVTLIVAVNGDTMPEPDETFFVNITSATGATVSDAQGLGTIQNDDIAIVQIHDIQGNGLTSPLNGTVVTTEGIVTAQKFNNGFFLQSADAQADADPNTSEGIFVFTSTAPPTSAAVGNRVRVTGTVAEFTPSTNPNQLSITQLTSPTIVLLSSGNPLPAPVSLNDVDFGAAANPGTAEKYEGMRVGAANSRVIAPAEGFITESSATSSTSGVFYVALPTVARPFREPGIGVLDVVPIPGGKNPPRFDTNPERIMVRSRGQVGANSLAVDADAEIPNLIGVLDYFSGTWAVLPDPGTLTATGGKAPTAVNEASGADVTIGGFNLLRFFDEINDSNGGPTLTAAALDKRLAKTSLAICEYLNAPDILGVVEVENLRVLGLLADRINSECFRAPEYVPFLVQGNDQGGINVGFLVSTRSVGLVNRVEVLEVTQFGKTTVLNNPDSSTSLLNDRPPLLLRAIVHHENGATFPVTVVVNHLRSLNGIDDTAAGSNGWATEGERVRTKRAKQAEFLAQLVHDRQVASPSERIILVGDFNAFEFNDGFADVLGIIRGDEVAADQVLTYLASPIVAPLIDGSQLIAEPAERYSYSFGGNAQTLDHVLVNEPVVLDAVDLAVDHARINADFGVHNFGVAGNALRVSDHDPVRLRITVPEFRSADLSVWPAVTPPTAHPGDRLTYTVEVTNGGPNDAPFAAVGLVFDALVSPVVTAPAGWTCDAPVQNAGLTTITCTTPNLVVDEIVSFTAEVIADAALANTTLTLSASIASQISDPANANNDAAISADIIAESDLSTVAAVSAGTVDVGGTARFTTTVGNAGPDPAAFASVALVFDARIASALSVTTSSGLWTCAAPVEDLLTTTVTCTTPNFIVGGSELFEANVVIPVDAFGALTMAAGSASQYFDPNSANNVSTASVLVREVADLDTVTQTTTPTVNVGETAQFSVRAENNGPSTIPTASLSLSFDALVTPTVVAPAPWTCTAPTQTSNTTTVLCTASPLPRSTVVNPFAVSFIADGAVAGRNVTLTSTMTSGLFDPFPNNNQTSATVTVRGSADLVATLAAATPSVTIGGTASYNATIANAGPNSVNDARIDLQFDALVSPTLTVPVDWVCGTPSQSGGITSLSCDASLASGASVPFQASFVADAALAGRSVRMSMFVTSSTIDPNEGNNAANASVSIAAPAGNADMSSSLLGGPVVGGTITVNTRVSPGGGITYVVPVRNNGPNPASNPRVVFTADVPLANATMAAVQAGWTCNSASTAGGVEIVCDLAGTLRSRGAAYFTLNLTAPNRTGTLTVRSTASSANPDPVATNNTATKVLQIVP